MPFKARDVLSRDELLVLTHRSDARGAWAIASTWAIIAATLGAAARWPHPAVIALALVVLGGRQLALAILMHEAAHRSLFRRRAGNDWLTDWLCARPIWNDVARYRAHHLRHHAHTNGDLDPDLSLVVPFPTTRRSLARKLLRDLVGITGLKRLVGLALMDLEILEYSVAGDPRRVAGGPRPLRHHLAAGARHAAGVAFTNAALFAALAALGHAWLYALWVGAYLTTFSVFVRVRSLAEHACTERSGDPLRNTRSTRAGLLARMTVAPLRVNHHLEHHLLVAVPYYRLPAMRRLLVARGVVEAAAPRYSDVLRAVTARR